MKKNGKPHNAELVCLLCDDPVHSRYLCNRHYHRQYRTERPQPPKRKSRPRTVKSGVKCLVTTCKVAAAEGTELCRSHGNRSRNWNLTARRLAEILEEDACSICGAQERLVLDHAHNLPCEARHRGNSGCGDCYRGLLCNGCNAAIGFMRDDVSRLQSAIRYLSESQV